MNKKKREEYQKLLLNLESQGKFDEYTIKFNEKNVTPVDKDYVFLPKGVFFKCFRCIILAVLFVFGPIVNFFAFNLKVKGRKNLKGIKGAVTISNHVLFIDTLVIKQTFGFGRTFMTGAKHNCKSGLFGAILKAGGFLALNGTYEANKNLYKSVSTLLSKGKFVNFNAERGMWLNYKKPRPLKNGAFKIATVNNVPIVPMYITFAEKSWIRDKFGFQPKVVAYILKPVYPDKNLCGGTQVQQMKEQVENEYKKAYEKIYGEKLSYLCDKNNNDNLINFNQTYSQNFTNISEAHKTVSEKFLFSNAFDSKAENFLKSENIIENEDEVLRSEDKSVTA